MAVTEYLAELKLRIPEISSTDTTHDDLLESYLLQAEADVREKRNYAIADETEARWKYTIIELALWYYAGNGVNGEKSRNEGGVDSEFFSHDEILKNVSSIARAV